MMRKWTLGSLFGLAVLAANPAFGVVTVAVGSGDPAGASTINIPVTLSSGGASVGGMQNDILFDHTVVTLTNATACKINAAIGTANEGCDADPVDGACKTLSRNLVDCGTTPAAPGCEGQPATMSRFRGIVAATAVPNNNAIPDGSVLYSCDFNIVNAAGLPTALANSNIVASDPQGVRLDSAGTAGSIGGGGPVSPSPTATEGGPTPTVPPAGCTGNCINVGSSTATSGTVPIAVTANISNLGGAQNDILFDHTKVTLANAAACKINAAIGTAGNEGCDADPVEGPCKTLSRNLVDCGVTPAAPGCEGQSANISRFRGIVAATAVPNNNVIPSGAVLYTCDFVVAGGLPAVLENKNIVASDPLGARIMPVGGDNGLIGPGEPPTDTPTPTNTPPTVIVPSNTPTVIVTNPTNTPTVVATTAVPATATATRTGQPTEAPSDSSTVTTTAPIGSFSLTVADGSIFPEDGGVIEVNGTLLEYVSREGNVLTLAHALTTAVPAGSVVKLIAANSDDDDGCNMSAHSSHSSAWMLVLPMFGLLILRRKRA